MFAAPLSFDGRIGQSEFLLSLTIVFLVIYGIIYEQIHYINSDIEFLISSIEFPVFIMAIWFGVAQTIKLSRDFELSNIPFKLTQLLFSKKDDKTETIQNTYIRFYICLMLILTCGVTTRIIQYISFSNNNEQVDLAYMILHIVFKTIFFVGFILLLHYRKVGFYLVTCGGLYYSIESIGGIILFPSSFQFSPIDAILELIIGLLYLPSFTILYIMLKKASEWEKLENGLKGINWKSVLTYFLVLELANYIATNYVNSLFFKYNSIF